jgi:hypothetical protein
MTTEIPDGFETNEMIAEPTGLDDFSFLKEVIPDVDLDTIPEGILPDATPEEEPSEEVVAEDEPAEEPADPEE